MSKRSYYGSPGGTRYPFGSSGKRAHEKLPPLPSCYEEALHRLILAINWNMENWGTTGQWKRAACQEREHLKQLRLNALGL